MGQSFCPKTQRRSPTRSSFRGSSTGFWSLPPSAPRFLWGFLPTPEESVQAVENFFLTSPKAHIREAVDRLWMSYGQVWKILRKSLKGWSHRPHLAQVLSPANKESRLAACTFWLNFTEEQFEREMVCSQPGPQQ